MPQNSFAIACLGLRLDANIIIENFIIENCFGRDSFLPGLIIEAWRPVGKEQSFLMSLL